MRSHAEHLHGPWTVADIGGTHARFACWSREGGLEPPLRLKNDAFAEALDLLADWFHRRPDAPRRVLLALAMPVGADARAQRLTNRAWQFEPTGLVDALHLEALVIVNDFAAAAAGIQALSGDELQPLNQGASVAGPGVRLVLGPGTGLGAAAILADAPPRVLASEAGHMTFASAAPNAPGLVAEGAARWGRLSWERVLSGAGLAWLHAHTSGSKGIEPETIARAAAAGNEAARATVTLFSRLLGEFAGDLCLALQALEGVYLCGGVLEGLRASFDAPVFLAAFADKGRFAAALRSVPVFFAAGHELGLLGAARFLEGNCRMPFMEWTR